MLTVELDGNMEFQIMKIKVANWKYHQINVNVKRDGRRSDGP